jgi:hypothetical protein
MAATGHYIKATKVKTISGKPFTWLLLYLISLFFSGCGVYSFTGASIPPEAETLSIGFIENKADLVEPGLSQLFTDALRQRFSSQTNLIVIPRDGDLQMEGEIRKYDVRPVAIQGDETAALNRLTIEVFITYRNPYDESKNFETSFSRFEDYSSNLDISAVKDVLIESINNQLIDDIFNSAVVNW